MRIAFIILFMFPLISVGQTNQYEQIAFEYFFQEVFEKEYTGINSIQFSGYTDKEVSSFGFLKPCFNSMDDYELNKKIEDASKESFPEVKKIDTTPIKQNIVFKSKRVKSRLKLNVLSQVKASNYHYVHLSVYKANKFWDVYFFEITSEGVVKRWCKTGQII